MKSKLAINQRDLNLQSPSKKGKKKTFDETFGKKQKRIKIEGFFELKNLKEKKMTNG